MNDDFKITRGRTANRIFVTLSREVVRDPRISATAKMIVMLAADTKVHPTSIAELTAHTLEAATREGRATIMAATAELEHYGYITRGPQGEFIINDTPGEVSA